jgi:hypothetical protein
MLGTRTLMRPQRRAFLALAVAAIAVLLAPVVWYLASPLFLTRAVSEAAPTAAIESQLRAGSFSRLDSIHGGEGTASLVQLANGQRVLRLGDDFRVTNGPDLYVYLSPAVAPRTSGELHADGAFEVAQLKGNIGGQNYMLPAELDLSSFKSVVIYCRRFTTVFSTAELSS